MSADECGPKRMRFSTVWATKAIQRDAGCATGGNDFALILIMTMEKTLIFAIQATQRADVFWASIPKKLDIGLYI